MAKQNGNATKKLLWIIGLLAVVLVGALLAAKQMGVLGGKEKGTEVEVAQAEIRDVTQVVTASGKVQPEVEVKISPDVSGEIIELHVKEGDAVNQGMLLARIKPDFYIAQAEQADAGVLQAKAAEAQRRADMLNAKAQLDRQQELFNKKVIPESEFLQAKTQFDVAQAALEAAQYAVQSAEARRREAREQLGKTSIYAPMTGTISVLNVELGERVVGTSQMQGTEMMRIAKLDKMEIEVDVNENDVVNVAIGDTATIEVDSYPERPFRGVVTEIANSARVTGAGTQEQVTNFPVKIRILDPHNVEVGGRMLVAAEGSTPNTPSFRPGMSGTVDVFTQTVRRAVAVPIQAVTVRDFNAPTGGSQAEGAAEEGGDEDAPEAETENTPKKKEDLRKVVFLMDNGKARQVEVETGISDDSHIVLTKGLQGNETVIIGPYRAVSRSLNDGDLVHEQKQEGDGGDRKVVVSSN